MVATLDFAPAFDIIVVYLCGAESAILRKGENRMAVRVAAYCRVSTDNDDQKNSLESQKIYFKEYIEKTPSWQNTGCQG